ncbi:MAG: dipeptide/oligopeptide/nickel transporter, permease protein [Hyphomicrobiales bacterium]|nr:dipeptide/oligopeptide/nickel transporter, permease protein [Hyphomicrobiales bacterium]
MRQALAQWRYVIAENPLTGFAFALFTLFVTVALFAPFLMPHSPLATHAADALRPPGGAYLLGTDQLGRDILSRLIAATRLDLAIGASAVALAFVFGVGLGLIAGYYGGWADRIIGRFTDTLMAFPLFVLAMAIVAALGNTVTNIVLATAIINIPLYARMARVETNIRRDAGYVAAARLTGNSEARILLGHILPNLLPIMAVQTSLTMGYAILNAAGLSFIGLGVQPPTPEWGTMVSEGASAILSGQWWVAVFPGLTLLLAVFCFNILGDGLRDVLDPRNRT